MVGEIVDMYQFGVNLGLLQDDPHLVQSLGTVGKRFKNLSGRRRQPSHSDTPIRLKGPARQVDQSESEFDESPSPSSEAASTSEEL